MLLVHFLCVEPKKNIGNSNQAEYVDKIYNKLRAEGLISGLVVGWSSDGCVIRDAVAEVEDGIFVIRFEYSESRNNAERDFCSCR